eukprot:gnl/TRDRNA2_/TRDRNA2_161955_c0_seq1.p2 gnl/TRDRNA2_/TRDRNA2_161955_c0~~gnl/TRDRNA2_/TRDRNA2_161955_c0_seq1.p2  ORF type:complete len:115 (+),score=12.70 gnl/TRDRNA2_/TRDRNA2_161955_c0_seq1:144-488(+)
MFYVLSTPAGGATCRRSLHGSRSQPSHSDSARVLAHAATLLTKASVVQICTVKAPHRGATPGVKLAQQRVLCLRAIAQSEFLRHVALMQPGAIRVSVHMCDQTQHNELVGQAAP